MHLTRIVILSLLLVALFSCVNNSRLNPKLSEIDNLTWTNPDSAYSLINEFDTTLLKNGMDSAMYRLLWAELRDKTYHDDTVTDEISKAALYFRLNNDGYNAMRALYYQGIIAHNAEMYGHTVVSLMEALEQSKHVTLKNSYYPAKIYGALSSVSHNIGDEINEELFARKSYEEYCKLDSAIFIIESKLWWATTLCQTGNPQKGGEIAKDIYLKSKSVGDYKNAEEALLIMANSALRKEEFERAKAYFNILLTEYEYDMSSNDLNLYMWALTDSDASKDSIEMVYQRIMKLTGEDDVTYEYYVSKGDYEHATNSLLNELSATEEKFGMRMRNDAGVALNSWHDEKIVESSLKLNALKERSLWIIILSVLCLSLCIAFWVINRFKMSNRINKLLKDILILREEGKRFSIRENELKAEIDTYRDSVDSYRSIVDEANNKNSNALDLWFKKIDDLYRQYYVTASSEENKKGLVATVSKEMEYLRTDDEMLLQMERHINSCNNNQLSELLGSLKRITADQRRLIVFLYFGLSVEAMCAIFDIKQSVLYNRKSRLLAHINNSSIKDVEEFIQKVFGKQ